MRNRAFRSTRFEAVPAAFEIAIATSNPDLAEMRRKHFDRLRSLFLEQGFCAARSPENRACTRLFGHADPLHWAESPQWRVVELWTGGELHHDAEIAS